MIEELLDLAAQEGEKGTINNDGGPFGAVIVDKDYNIVSKGHNMVLSSNDPTNHAEIVAIRNACQKLGTSNLEGCTIFSSCEPCPMCLSAIMWANIKNVYYGATRIDAEEIGFKDKKIYDYFKKENSMIKAYNCNNLKCKDLLKNYKGNLY